ncbi:hypothetical protein HPB47_027265 [Ixodes persulcatus]|uniref:Uncharacterized protein n=1 Tax=Ixodes persulcatus TaxID=34615 RepID=A0AC60PWB7_IXOPE|nr:hypothetical protein HPB47_027265 [Ixodes persulcatus]
MVTARKADVRKNAAAQRYQRFSLDTYYPEPNVSHRDRRQWPPAHEPNFLSTALSQAWRPPSDTQHSELEVTRAGAQARLASRRM